MVFCLTVALGGYTWNTIFRDTVCSLREQSKSLLLWPNPKFPEGCTSIWVARLNYWQFIIILLSKWVNASSKNLDCVYCLLNSVSQVYLYHIQKYLFNKSTWLNNSLGTSNISNCFSESGFFTYFWSWCQERQRDQENGCLLLAVTKRMPELNHVC